MVRRGVDGSSPSEGFRKQLQIRGFVSIAVAARGDTRSHRGRTGGPWPRIRHDPLLGEQGGVSGIALRRPLRFRRS